MNISYIQLFFKAFYGYFNRVRLAASHLTLASFRQIDNDLLTLFLSTEHRQYFFRVFRISYRWTLLFSMILKPVFSSGWFPIHAYVRDIDLGDSEAKPGVEMLCRVVHLDIQFDYLP